MYKYCSVSNIVCLDCATATVEISVFADPGASYYRWLGQKRLRRQGWADFSKICKRLSRFFPRSANSSAKVRFTFSHWHDRYSTQVIPRKKLAQLVISVCSTFQNDLHPPIGGPHPVLYFTTQTTKKYCTAMWYDQVVYVHRFAARLLHQQTTCPHLSSSLCWWRLLQVMQIWLLLSSTYLIFVKFGTPPHHLAL